MSDHRIEPSKVTKPIQLLAAWLAGLLLTNTAFLTAAAHITKPDWASGALVVSAILNVPIFLFCLFLLQTRFRPEMQEDVFYSRYLERRYSAQTARSELVEVVVPNSPQKEYAEVIDKTRRGAVRVVRTSSRKKKTNTPISINDLLPSYSELRAEFEKFDLRIVETFGSSSGSPERRPGPPSPFIISIRSGDIAEIKQIIDICIEYGLVGINRDDDPDEDTDAGVYVGSYYYEVAPYVSMSKSVLEQIRAPKFSWQDLTHILESPDRPPTGKQKQIS